MSRHMLGRQVRLPAILLPLLAMTFLLLVMACPVGQRRRAKQRKFRYIFATVAFGAKNWDRPKCLSLRDLPH